MPVRISPVLQIFSLVSVSVVCAVLAVGVAHRQPYLGLRLLPQSPVEASVDASGIVIAAVRADSPATDLAADFGAGSQGALLALTDASGQTVTLSPADLIEEPDALESYAAMSAFFARQGQIATMLRSGPVTLQVWANGASQVHTVEPRPTRPVQTLPFAFWLQIGVGLGGVWIGAWIWGLRRTDWATRCLAFSGVGLMVSAFAAALYSTRELALPTELFRTLSALNHFGAFVFGAGMIGLFMVYPRHLYRAAWLSVPVVVLGVWYAVAQTGGVQSPVIGIHLGVVVALLAIAICVGQQYWATRGDPRDRAALSWLGLAVLVGSGAFVVTVIAPRLLGTPAYLSQSLAFVFFLLIYLGVALGVARFQLFQLADWAYRILFYVMGVLLLLAIDALLIFTIVDDRAPAFALSLLIVTLVWLPFRDTLGRWLLNRKDPPRAARFRRIIDVALTPPEHDQLGQWHRLLADMFNPLRVTSGSDSPTPTPAPSLRDDGLILALPCIGPLAALDLHYADAGRRLFSTRDLELATEMTVLLTQAFESRAAYEKGVNEERSRIARDIHDNIGVQLMAALHSPEAPRKDVMIRETLTDLRDIINNASNPDLSVADVLGDLRAQIAEQLLVAGVRMTWAVNTDPDVALPVQMMPMIRSMIREAVQNALKHAAPTQLDVALHGNAAQMQVRVRDNGRGFDPAQVVRGNGLANLRDRVQAVGGHLTIDSTPLGTSLVAEIPLPILTGGSA